MSSDYFDRKERELEELDRLWEKRRRVKAFHDDEFMLAMREYREKKKRRKAGMRRKHKEKYNPSALFG